MCSSVAVKAAERRALAPARRFISASCTRSPASTISARLASGEALPSWLVFDGVRLSGSPPADWNGSLEIAVLGSDGQMSASDRFTLTVTPVNDAPFMAEGTSARGAVVEQPGSSGSNVVLQTGGTLRFTDVDASDLHATTVGTVSASGNVDRLPSAADLRNWLSIGAVHEPNATDAGSVAWSFGAPDAAFDYLAAGETVTLTYQAEISDGQGAVAAQPLTITVTGTNDLPTIAQGTTASGSITERTDTGGSTSIDHASGTLRFVDLDRRDRHAADVTGVTVVGATDGLPAAATLLSWLSTSALVEQVDSASGSVDWSFAAPDGTFDYLSAGRTAELHYVIRVADDRGGSVDQTVIVTVTGTNDAPVIASDTSATGSVAERVGAYGSTALDTATGTIRFSDLDLVDVHAASIGGVSTSGATRGLPPTDRLLAMLAFSSVEEPSGSTSGGVGWTFAAADREFDYLADGETVTLTYAAAIADGQGGVGMQPITITVTGSGDAPTIAAGTSATATLTERDATTGSTASVALTGTIRFADSDVRAIHTAGVVGMTVSGRSDGLPSGTTMLDWFTQAALVEQDGATAGSAPWRFAAPDSAFDYLRSGETATLVYTVRISDGHGGTVDQPVSVTVTGTNDLPLVAVGTSAAGTITERAGVSGSTTKDIVSGTVRFNDADLGDVHAVGIGGVVASGATTGLPATEVLRQLLSLGALIETSARQDGGIDWSFAAADNTFDYLAAGESVTLTYLLQVTDGQGGTLDQPVTVTVVGSEDAPILAAGTAVTGAIVERDRMTGSTAVDPASGVIRFTDLDRMDVHAATITGVTVSGDTTGLPANATLMNWFVGSTLSEQSGTTAGSLPWSFSAPDAAFDYLAAGQIATLSYGIQITDGKGGSVAQTVTVTVTGTNDLPTVATGTTASAALTERTNGSGLTAIDGATGTIRFVDADLADVHSAAIGGVTISGSATGLPGDATVLGWMSRNAMAEQASGAAASLAWQFSAADSTFDYLRAGQSVALTYAFQIKDGQGGVLEQPVTITITGTNDAPIIASGTSASGAITERTGSIGSTLTDAATGTIRFVDLDVGDAHSASVATVSATGVTGGLPSNAALQALLSLGGVTEQSSAIPGSIGWSFGAADSTFDYLAADETVTLTYTVQIADGQGGLASQAVVLTVTGTQDVPTIAAGTNAVGAISELSMTTGSNAADTASGTIRFADVDQSDLHIAVVTGVTVSGVTSGLPANATLLGWFAKGALVEQSPGAAGSLPWSFSATDSAFDYLRAGQTATLVYAVQVGDGRGGNVTQNVTITITGTDDVPLIANGTSASGAIAELANTTGSTTNDTASGTIRFTDADSRDTHAASVASVSASGTTSGLPANGALLALVSLGTLTEPLGSTAGSLGWNFAAADKAFDYLAQGETVTLTYAIQVSDGQGGTLTQPVTVTVTGANDGPAVATGTGASATVTELANTTGSNTNDTASGIIRFTDPDIADTHAATIASVAASGVTTGLPSNAAILAWLAVGTDTEPNGSTAGSQPWSFAAPDAAFDYLGAGQTATFTYSVRISDGRGGSVSQNVTIAVTGTNDAPVVVVPGAQIARTSTATRITGLSIGDPDANAGSETATLTTTLGTIAATATNGATVTGSASKSLKISGTIAQVNATLATLTYTSTATGSDTIAVATSDGTVTTTRSIAVTTSASANHGPAMDAATTAVGAVSEISGVYGSTTADTASGSLRFTDADVPDTHTITISSVAASGITAGLPANATLLAYLTAGSVTEPSGTTPGAATWTFSAPDKTFDYLGAGQVATLSYVVTVKDSKNATVTQTVTITAAGTNDAAVLATGSTTTSAVSERAATLGSTANDTASGAIRFTDESGDTHSATIIGVASSGTATGLPANATMLTWLGLGALTEQSGTTAGSLPWNFAAPDSAFDYLGKGKTATLTYTVQITDDRGAVMTQAVTVTVTGTNDVPTAAAKSGYTADNWAALTITGATLTAGATDPDSTDVQVLSSVQGAVNGSVALTSGNAVFTPSGTYVGPASFTYTISDGNGGTSTATASLNITLHQTNGTSGADTLTGTTGKKAQIDGLAGADKITAGSAGDVIIGGAGNDTLTGAAGIDTFVYRAGFGMDTIASFTATGTSHDVLQFDKSVFADWSHLLGATKQVGSDLLITYDSTNTITLKSVALANFTTADASFV